jgi:hypothetical protein
MTSLVRLLAATALVAAIAAPAAAQYYPQPTYPQQYPYPQTYPQQTYPQQAYPYGYGYNQGYTGNPVTDIIDQLLGNRYSVTDRQAVRQCARAAQVQAQNQYGAYGQRYGYNQGIAAPAMRVTSITSVERRSNGLRVRGTLGSGYAGQYGNRYGYQGQGYGYAGDVTFRCNVDYRGAVTDVRIGGYARRY